MKIEGQMVVPVVVPAKWSEYLPPWFKICKACNELGQYGSSWINLLSVYYTGTRLMTIEGIPPFVRLKEDLKWCEISTNQRFIDFPCNVWVETTSDEFDKREIKIRFAYGAVITEEYKMKKRSLLHVVRLSNDEIKVLEEVRPLPFYFFEDEIVD